MNNIQTPILEERIVCFIDILGFAGMIHEAARGNQSTIIKIDKALQLVREIGDKVAMRKGSDPAVHIFSDSVIIATDPSSNAANALVDALAELSWELAAMGVFIRGAITIGNISSHKERPWGPAIVEAYRMESTVANHPRIVLHSQFLSFLKKEAHDLMATPLIARDPNDGVFFLNFFGHRLGQHLPVIPQELPLAEIEQIRNNLSKQHDGATDDPGVYRKIEWLRHLWDGQFSAHADLGNLQTRHGHENDPVRIYRDALDRELQNGVVIDGGEFDNDYSKLPQA